MPDEPSGDLVGLSPYEVELCDARRALRVAGWATSEFRELLCLFYLCDSDSLDRAVFYLITTDILGPFNGELPLLGSRRELAILTWAIAYSPLCHR